MGTQASTPSFYWCPPAPADLAPPQHSVPGPLLSAGSCVSRAPSLPVSPPRSPASFSLLLRCCWLSAFCKLAISRCICCHGNIRGEFKVGEKSLKNPKTSWISPLFCVLSVQSWTCSYISGGVCKEPFNAPRHFGDLAGVPNHLLSPFPLRAAFSHLSLRG